MSGAGNGKSLRGKTAQEGLQFVSLDNRNFHGIKGGPSDTGQVSASQNAELFHVDYSQVMSSDRFFVAVCDVLRTLTNNFFMPIPGLHLAEVTESPEVIAMRKLSHHPNILHIIEFHVDPIPGKVTFIFELMEMSLYDMMKNRKRPMPEIRVKRYMYQLLKGLDHLHHHGLFHRDIKPENILIKNEIVKLADLGSIRGAYSRPPYTEYISTRWYRSPECLLTTGYYGPKMDVWACGCVFFELLTTRPLFPGTNEVDQISKIHDVLGTPHTRLLAKFHRHKPRNCEYFFQSRSGTGLSCLVPNLSENGRDILKQMLTYNPEHRSNARRLLEHRYFNDLRDHDILTLKKPQTITKEWRNPLLLSHIMSGEKKKKSKLLKKRMSPQKSGKDALSTSMQSFSTNGNSISYSLGSQTLPLLHRTNSEKSNGPITSKTLDYINPKKVEKRIFNSEAQITSKRSWGANPSNGKVINEQKIEPRPMKRKTSPQFPKVLIQANQSPMIPHLSNYDSRMKESSNFGSLTLPNMDFRKLELSAPKKIHQSGVLASYRSSKNLGLLSTIPERIRKKALDVRFSPDDSSSIERVVKKPRGH